MVAIAFVGAGSTVFAQKLLGDLLAFPELAGADIRLHDIDARRLRTTEIVAGKIARQLGASPTVTATTDRRAALAGADVVMTMFQVGGWKPATVTDFEIPRRYGLRQTIGDTGGIGGIMRALRTIPVLLDVCRDMEALCPDALLLNYVNPMAMNCWAISRASAIRTVGLCHSVPHTAEHLAHDLGIPAEGLRYRVAGINHMAFFLEFWRDGQGSEDQSPESGDRGPASRDRDSPPRTSDVGLRTPPVGGGGREDLYPRLRALAEDISEGRRPAPERDYMPWRITDAVRYEMLRRLGYFVTESSEHFAEYVPYFLKGNRPELAERYDVPVEEYLRRLEWRAGGWETLTRELETSDAPLELDTQVDYGPLIAHSLVTGQPRTVYGNVPNRGLIDNLPAGCCVEVPCLADGNGVQPTAVGALPPQLAALMMTNVNVQSLTVEAALTGNREHVHHAAMLEPRAASELTLDEIASMVDEMIEAHADWLPTGF